MTTIDASAERHIACDGAFNVRDLGGYRAEDGRVVRWRTVFRADGLHRIPEGGRTVVAELGWRTVLDLRTVAEVEAGWFAYDRVDVVHVPVLRETWSAADVGEEIDDVAGFLAARYLEMVEQGAPALATAFELLASPVRLPAVFHCSAGKDRTGVLAALVLATLGVDDEQIAADYHLSAAAMDRLTAWITATRPDIADAMASQPAAFLACPPEAILCFLSGLRERHGSVEGYLADIDVPASTVVALRDLLLER